MAKLIAEEKVGSGLIRILQGDLTLAETEAIVNAANSHLQHGGGVAAAIVRRGGKIIQDESDAADFVPEGEVAVTGGGALAAKYVIHAVGPVYRGGRSGESDLLAGCYRTAMQLAADHALRTIAFPAISCGVYGYPLDEAARIALTTVRDALMRYPQIEQAVFVLFDAAAYQAYERALAELLRDEQP